MGNSLFWNDELMKHPPIPPKSRYFKWNDEDAEWDFIYHSYRMDKPYEHHVGLDWFLAGWDAPYIAAIAEVEWLKRADRWHKVSQRSYDRNPDSTRSDHWMVNGFICKDNSKLWRKWEQSMLQQKWEENERA